MRLLLLAALIGCYGPSAPQGAPCVDDDHCPAPQRCAADGHCSLFDAAPDVALGPRFAPSNGIAAAIADTVAVDVAFPTGISTLDTDTGAISGALTRAAGAGVIADIDFSIVNGLGVFAFHRLAVPVGAKLHVTGANAVVLLIGTTATIDGDLDGSAGCVGSDRACAGPGGGTGARDLVAPATGCGAGGPGGNVMANNFDGGGGGGGGGAPGAAGGTANTGMGGLAGNACLANDLQPLVGGSGGGTSPKGAALTFGHGGGGGGALQLSALESATIDGTIAMGGAGGEGAPPDTGTDAGGGAGGGGGGGILVEGPQVVIGPLAILAANGGGGGGGGAGNNGGQPGANAMAGATGAVGGAGANPAEVGGAGGALTPAQPGASTTPNGGGGGGGAGRIVLRAQSAPSGGTLSPRPVLVAVP